MKNNSLTLSKTFKLTASFMMFGLLNSSYVMSEYLNPEDVPIPDCGSTNESTQKISYKFNDIPLKDVMQLVRHASQTEITGMDLLEGKKVSVAANCVDSTEFATALLLVNGFELTSNQDNWIITKM